MTRYPSRYTVPVQESREPESRIPVAMPIGFDRPESLESVFARLLHRHTEERALEGFDSPEEGDDFEDDDPDWLLDMSPYELPSTVPDAPVAFDQLDPGPGLEDGAKAPQNSSQEASDEAGTPEPPESGG